MANKNSKSVMRVATDGRRPRNATEGWRNSALGAACVAIAVLAGSPAHSDPTDATADSEQLVEITVTAQRHVENVQKVPISVVAITPDTAINAGAISSDQLAQIVPGMQMGHEINSATTPW